MPLGRIVPIAHAGGIEDTHQYVIGPPMITIKKMMTPERYVVRRRDAQDIRVVYYD